MTIATSTKEWISDIDIDIDADGQWPEYSVTIFFIYLPSRLIVILELTLLLTQPIDKQENLMKLHVGEYSTQAGKLWNHRHGDDLDQSEDSVGKPRNRGVSWSSDIDLSPNALDSPVVLSKGIGAEVDLFQTQRSFLAIFSPTNDTSTTPTMAGSLQTVDQTLPNSTNTLTNTSATGGGGGGVDSAATAVKITVEAAHK
eukprot:scaffold8377_cov75-Cyclotella_meneghiniana.AAC.1